ncbi:MAG: hypothetical protein JO339_17595 [Alphaproteobacteria bacterium]|nr:hypothetical protein [Alphaproteobacteria bacterium]
MSAPGPNPTGGRLDQIDSAGRSTAYFIGRYNDDVPLLLGSGTFIQCRRLVGVLTCAHVAEAVTSWKTSHEDVLRIPRERRQVSIIALGVGGTGSSFDLQPDALESRLFGSAPRRMEHPDLAFVRLPEAANAHFDSVAIIRNIERHRDFWKARRETAPYDAVVAAVHEWQGAPEDGQTYGSFKARGYTPLGRLSRELRCDHGFDKWVFSVTKGQRSPPPKDFGGTSGGGVWRLRVERDDDRNPGLEPELIGVATMQTRHDRIIVHGPKSIFDILVPAMRQWWPAQTACA